MTKKRVLVVVLLVGAAMLVPVGAIAKHGKDKDKGGCNHKGNRESAEQRCFKPDVLQKILRDNPGLPHNFLTHSLPDTPIKLRDGKTYPLYQLDQFLQANFTIEWYARQAEGKAIVDMMSHRLRKLMALPDFYERVLHHKPQYIISPQGKVSALEAYNHFRHCDRRLGVTAGKQYHAPVGGGGGIAAPSWATWKAINLFEHETCHCIGIGHNSGGLSGPIAGTLRQWDRQKKWNYPTIDANTLVVTAKEAHAKASTEVGKVHKGKGGKRKHHGDKGGAEVPAAGTPLATNTVALAAPANSGDEDGDDEDDNGDEDSMSGKSLDDGPETDHVIMKDDENGEAAKQEEKP